jgi:hypothetical protein
MEPPPMSETNTHTPDDSNPLDVDLGTRVETFANDLMLAIGALSAISNERLNRVAQGLHDARPLLTALIALGREHPDELQMLLARDCDECKGEGVTHGRHCMPCHKCGGTGEAP